MASDRRFRFPRAFLSPTVAAASVLASLVLSGCTSDMCTTNEVIRGRTPCRCDNCADWDAYREVIRGETPCRCNDRCAPACAPCAPPCGRPCSAVMPDLPPGANPAEWYRVYTPAVYETFTEVVTVECERTDQVWVPPVYRTELHRVFARPEVRCDLPVDGATRSVVMCCETCPAQTMTRTRCETDECGCPQSVTETCLIPAKTCKQRKEVPVLEPTCHPIWEPALYTIEPCDVEERPGHWMTVTTPPLRETVTHRVCKCPESWTWKHNDRCVAPAPTAMPVPAPAAGAPAK